MLGIFEREAKEITDSIVEESVKGLARIVEEINEIDGTLSDNIKSYIDKNAEGKIVVS